MWFSPFGAHSPVAQAVAAPPTASATQTATLSTHFGHWEDSGTTVVEVICTDGKTK